MENRIDPGIILTNEEVIEFKQLIKSVRGKEVTLKEAQALGSDLILALELLENNIQNIESGKE